MEQKYHEQGQKTFLKLIKIIKTLKYTYIQLSAKELAFAVCVAGIKKMKSDENTHFGAKTYQIK